MRGGQLEWWWECIRVCGWTSKYYLQTAESVQSSVLAWISHVSTYCGWGEEEQFRGVPGGMGYQHGSTAQLQSEV